jgi:MFS family permease
MFLRRVDFVLRQRHFVSSSSCGKPKKNTNRLISGRKWALIIADCIFLLGSLIQTLCAINTTSLTQLYIGRVIGGFGVGLISAVVPTYIGENANKEIRGRCIGW